MKNQMLVESLKSECVKCGEDRLTLIEFHHVIPSEKEFEVTQYMNQGYGSIWKEAAKCVCLCKDCHDKFHRLFGKRPENQAAALNDFLKYDY